MHAVPCRLIGSSQVELRVVKRIPHCREQTQNFQFQMSLYEQVKGRQMVYLVPCFLIFRTSHDIGDIRPVDEKLVHFHARSYVT